MKFLNKKADLGDIGEWIIPALVAFVLGFLLAWLMSQGIIPNIFGLF